MEVRVESGVRSGTHRTIGSGMDTDATIREWEGACRSVAQRYYLPDGDHEDLMQAARIGAWKGLRDHDPAAGMSFVSFMFMAIEREVITAVEASTRQKHRPVNEAVTVRIGDDGEERPALELVAAGDRTDPEWALELTEDLDELRRDMHETLSWIEAHTLVRLELGGESYATIGEELGVTTKAVDRAISRARWKLRGEGPPSKPDVVRVTGLGWWLPGLCGPGCAICELLDQFASSAEAMVA
jgi:RNA polymerase sporulation-specific sigma factor